MTTSAVSPLFPARVEEFLFWLAIVVGFVVPFLYFARWSRQNAASIKTRPGTDVSSLTCFAIVPMAVIAIFIGYARVGTLPNWLFYPGMAMFLLGLALTAWAYRTLGRFFSLEVQIQGDHRVVDTGPYRLLRHPGYAGVVVGFIGLGAAVQSWVSLLLLVLGMTAVLGYRMWIEERFLVAELGDDYVRYMARSKRLVPFVW
ncbi:MAG TPA: isoprenylcysteine carboxylmethyltransferase family protein [Terriglobales bacterium]|nr:isoprenylcysteine carboxylmethyltransferase family protein [Terriglobales bacterium]